MKDDGRVEDAGTETVAISGEMLTLARKRAGFSQRALAEVSGISASVLSRVESGTIRRLASELVEKLAKSLRVLPSFFDREDDVRHLGFHRLYRLQRKIGARELDLLEAELDSRRLHLIHFLRSVELAQKLKLPDVESFEGFSPEEAAERLRALWMVRSGPIPNVTALLESAGILIVEVGGLNTAFEGLAVHAFGGLPMIFVRAGQPDDRRRLTLVHELAHLILHTAVNPEQDKEANRFAAEFLFPAAEARRKLAPFSLSRAIQLKQELRLSIQFMVMRAASLDLISSDEKQRFFKELSARRWRKDEPFSQPCEPVRLVPRVLDTLRNELGYSAQELALELGEHIDLINDLYFPAGQSKGLRLVT